MLSRKIFVILFAIIAFFSFSFAQEETKTINKSIDVDPNVYFMVKNKYGKVEVTGSDQNKITIDVLIKAKGDGAKAFVDAVMINIKESRSNVSANTVYPSMDSKRNFSYSVDYVIKTPYTARIKIENDFGNASVNDVKGDVDVDVSYGNIDLNKCLSKNIISSKFSGVQAVEIGADSRISNSYGKTKIDKVNGDIEVTSSFGDIDLKNVTGNIIVTNGYGSIYVDDIGGRANLSNQFGKISAKNVKGIFDITNKNSEVSLSTVESGRVTNSFGSINIEDARGNSGININNKNGSVRVNRSNSNILLQNQYDFIELKDIKGRVDIQANNCSIMLNEIQGDIKLENSYGSVEMYGIFGDVNARNISGRVYISDIKKLGRTYIVENEYGPIEIDFPKNLSATINATTYYGSIESDCPLQIKKTASRTEATCKMGDGASNVKLETKSASISVNCSGINVETNVNIKTDSKVDVQVSTPPKPMITPDHPGKPEKVQKKNDASARLEREEYINNDYYKLTYESKDRDNLVKISRRFHVKISDLKKWNRFLAKFDDDKLITRRTHIAIYKKN